VPVPQPPKANPVRRNARVGTVKLPAEGRKGATPKWPLPARPAEKAKAKALAELWAELWHTPQATAWDRLGWTRVVARYAQLLNELECGDIERPAPILGEVRQLEDRLGLTPKAMRLLLWEIVEDQVAEKRATSTAKSARRRIKAVG
jgi:hypothetical protein